MKTKRATTLKTRNAGSLTESQYWGKIRSALRKAFQYWKPMQIALDQASRKYEGPNKLQKKEYQCAHCSGWFKRTEVQIDHIIECGSLRSFEDIEGFLRRLTPEDPAAFDILCKPCHLAKTKEDKQKKKDGK